MHAFAAAATGIDAQYLQGYKQSIVDIINGLLIPVLIAIAFIVFLWGVYRYFIYGADNPAKRKEGSMFILYGVIGFVVLFSIWGIVQIFISTLNLPAANAPEPPTINTSGGANAPQNNSNNGLLPGQCSDNSQCYYPSEICDPNTHWCALNPNAT